MFQTHKFVGQRSLAEVQDPADKRPCRRHTMQTVPAHGSNIRSAKHSSIDEPLKSNCSTWHTHQPQTLLWQKAPLLKHKTRRVNKHTFIHSCSDCVILLLNKWMCHLALDVSSYSVPVAVQVIVSALCPCRCKLLCLH